MGDVYEKKNIDRARKSSIIESEKKLSSKGSENVSEEKDQPEAEKAEDNNTTEEVQEVQEPKTESSNKWKSLKLSLPAHLTYRKKTKGLDLIHEHLKNLYNKKKLNAKRDNSFSVANHSSSSSSEGESKQGNGKKSAKGFLSRFKNNKKSKVVESPKESNVESPKESNVESPKESKTSKESTNSNSSSSKGSNSNDGNNGEKQLLDLDINIDKSIIETKDKSDSDSAPHLANSSSGSIGTKNAKKMKMNQSKANADNPTTVTAVSDAGKWDQKTAGEEDVLSLDGPKQELKPIAMTELTKSESIMKTNEIDTIPKKGNDQNRKNSQYQSQDFGNRQNVDPNHKPLLRQSRINDIQQQRQQYESKSRPRSPKSSSSEDSSEEEDNHQGHGNQYQNQGHQSNYSHHRQQQQYNNQYQQFPIVGNCGQYGVMPMRSMGFIAPHIAFPSNNNGCFPKVEESSSSEDEDCPDHIEDGVEFSYKPQPKGRTELTLTVEPKRQPWLTMMRFGFRPMINCTAPPCCMTQTNNPYQPQSYSYQQNQPAYQQNQPAYKQNQPAWQNSFPGGGHTVGHGQRHHGNRSEYNPAGHTKSIKGKSIISLARSSKEKELSIPTNMKLARNSEGNLSIPNESLARDSD